MSDAPKQVWNEVDSAQFIDRGYAYTPRRDELQEAFLTLIPVDAEEAFTGAELGTGAGWLMRAILDRFPQSVMIGLDGSEAMLAETARALESKTGRFELAQFRLEEEGWIERLPDGLACIVSSLVIHHLDDVGKRALFPRLLAKLRPGGALLICDVVKPANARGQHLMAIAWDADVAANSAALTGDDRIYRQFLADEWNIYAFPDPDDQVDKPSRLLDQLRWLEEAGFAGIDVWWARAGHALFGGYRPEEPER